MSVKIRLQRRGRKKKPFYHIVVADAKAPRDGRFIEKIGTYNPLTKPATIVLDRHKALEWIINGASPTETVRAILRFKGVLFMKHLQRGVNKGAFTQEDAEKRFQDWLDAKEVKVSARVEQTRKEELSFHARVFGEVKKAAPKAAPAPPEESASADEAGGEEE